MGIFSGFFRGKGDKERDYLIERASKTQVGLLPNSIPQIEGYQIKVYSQSAKALSGDYYDFFLDQENKRLETIIMDVSGKDFPAAITVSQLSGAMYILFKDPEMPIAEKMRQLNAMIFDRTQRETFVTALVMRLDYGNNVMSFVNSGHNPLVVAGAKMREEKGAVAPAIGFVEDAKFKTLVRATEIPMEEEMVIVAYTDGITEDMDAKRNEYGIERFMKLIEQHRGKDLSLLTEAIKMDIQRHEAGEMPHDDQTVIAFRRTAM